MSVLFDGRGPPSAHQRCRPQGPGAQGSRSDVIRVVTACVHNDDDVSMRGRRGWRAGRYAEARYQRGLRAYRRRMRVPLALVTVPMFVFFVTVVLVHELDPWSVAAGGVAGAGGAILMFVRDDPPAHVANWGRGAEGERLTEKELRQLERQGWTVEHDVERPGRANLDHIVSGPLGVFLVETKFLDGTITLEDGVLTVRRFDDPDEVYALTTLAGRVRGQAADLSRRLQQDSGRGPWVAGVVCVWGRFQQDPVEHERVTYLHGNHLAEWLRSRPPRNQRGAASA